MKSIIGKLKNIGRSWLFKNSEPAFILFHQGWTDIFNCLALVTYYSKKYQDLTLIIREDALPIAQFYLRESPVKIKAVSKIIMDNCPSGVMPNKKTSIKLYHGDWDQYREDIYKGAFHKSNNFFVKKFYESYGISYNVRVNQFELRRDMIQENAIYDEFIKRNGEKYILVHQDTDRELLIPLGNYEGKVFNLNGASRVFFDWIKVLENAQEIHLIDSVWGAFIYQLDARYRIFKNIPIHLYCLRGYEDMYKYPITLSNWVVE
jgi:hypothetical protein